MKLVVSNFVENNHHKIDNINTNQSLSNNTKTYIDNTPPKSSLNSNKTSSLNSNKTVNPEAKQVSCSMDFLGVL